jgi:mannitol/fructose-specific phosphotransferase system IIA component (Ntr-type)
MSNVPVLEESAVRAHATAENRKDVITMLAELLKKDLPPGIDVAAALTEREQHGSTAMPGGVAFPHCALAYEGPFRVAVVTVKDGVDFSAPDGSPTRLFVGIAGPERDRSGHIKLLAGIAKGLRSSAAVEQICSISSDSDLYTEMVSLLPTADVGPEKGPFAAVTIRTTSRDNLEQALELFAGETDCSITVTEGGGAGSYLHRMPIFATFWGADQQKVVWTIEAILPQSQVNSVVRRLESMESAAGDLLVTVLALEYTSGQIAL